MSVDLAIVPVAGQGTRLLPSTKSQPKEMLPVGRKPVVQYVVEELALSGVPPTAVRHRPRQDVHREPFRYQCGADRLSARDRQGRAARRAGLRAAGLTVLLHAADAVNWVSDTRCCAPGRSSATQPFVVALGDSIIGVERAIEHPAPDDRRIRTKRRRRGGRLRVGATRRRASTTASRSRGARPGPCSSWKTLSRNRASPKPRARWPWPPVTCSAPRIFDLLERTPPGKGGEIQLTDAIRLLMQQGGKVLGMRLTEGERRFDIGNFESYFRAFIEFALADPRYGAELREWYANPARASRQAR